MTRKKRKGIETEQRISGMKISRYGKGTNDARITHSNCWYEQTNIVSHPTVVSNKTQQKHEQLLTETIRLNLSGTNLTY